ncbi:MAG: hypothetical protein DRQ99_25375 [Candidatus Parabeggiatoa sp. nov. 3]|nr:MAG: hypothetical protein DRQ99_25375 [Gammaproteobacteria bacterium]
MEVKIADTPLPVSISAAFINQRWLTKVERRAITKSCHFGNSKKGWICWLPQRIGKFTIYIPQNGDT